ncbi:MAG: hypothetical protein GOP50_08230 [Candidatus Heimdallarchaeota archaeon]|nr:hypothetical protein [Candidatus Heimdallarchaeota archaeon]
MTKSLDEVLNSLGDICDKAVKNSENYGIEFGTFSPHKLKATNVKCIVTSPLMNLKLVHFMKENNATLAITLLPLSITQTKFPLIERDFELLKALVTNNIKTILLPDEWIYSLQGSFAYFLQTLGLTNADTDEVTGIGGSSIINWEIQSISFNDFLANLGHLNKKWMAYPFASEDSNLSFILERDDLSLKELELLRNEGVNTIVSFKIDSKKLQMYQSNKLNFIYIPYVDYCNIALRKFSQVLQLEVGEQVLFKPFETKDGINYTDYQNKN